MIFDTTSYHVRTVSIGRTAETEALPLQVCCWRISVANFADKFQWQNSLVNFSHMIFGECVSLVSW